VKGEPERYELRRGRDEEIKVCNEQGDTSGGTDERYVEWEDGSRDSMLAIIEI